MKNKNDWPRTVHVGNVTVTLYKRLTPAGNPAFLLGFHDDGKRKLEACGTDEAKAIQAATKKAETLSTHGARVAGVTWQQVAELVSLGDMLNPFGVSVAQAVQRTAGWLSRFTTLDGIDRALVSGPVQSGPVTARTVAKAVEEMIEQKKANGASKKYSDDIKYRLQNKFAPAFVCNVDTITTAHLQGWLDGRKMPARTYMNFQRLINVFFEFCLARNYCAFNPAEKVETRKIKTGEVLIYTPDEMKKLLAKASDEFRPMLAICGFAGLRTEEFKRLTWAGVDFKTGNIILDAGQTKTAARRVIPLAANLRAWLEPYKDKTGLVWTDGDIHHVQERVGKAAGVPWKKNALRHSFCSYRLSLTGDIARTAFEAGNSAKIIHGHYKALVNEDQAKEWFALTP